MTAIVLRGDARQLPLPDASVDLIVTSPPYFGLRSYTDGGEHYAGQIGSEGTPQAYLEALWACTREWVRVLKPEGSLFVNLGDKYGGSSVGGGYSDRSTLAGFTSAGTKGRAMDATRPRGYRIGPDKSLLGLPWRYAIGVTDRLGLILRAEIIWCLSGGARVYARTPTGDRPVMLRDLARSYLPQSVQLWNGRQWTQVLGWNRSPDRDGAIELELRTGERIGCTPGHRWPTQRGVIRADEIRVGDVIETTRLPEPEDPAYPHGLGDDDIGWLVGLYLAEGSRSEKMLQFAGHKDENERHARLARITTAYHGNATVYQTSENGATCNVSGSVLLGIIDHYVGRGRTARSKRLRKAAWQRNNRFLTMLAVGYLDGDGHYDAKNDRYRLGFTANDELAADLRTLAARLGTKISLRRGVATYDGRRFPMWRGEWRWTRSLHHNVKQDGEVVAIRASRAREFYDVGVADEPHLFALASGVLTHNSKPNGLPESVTDRVRRAHEQVFHLVKQPRYYAAVDEIREPTDPAVDRHVARYNGRDYGKTNGHRGDLGASNFVGNPLGKLPGSVWSIPSAPLQVPAHLGIDHFAAFPPALVRPLVLGWSPPGVCTGCGEGRRPVVDRDVPDGAKRYAINGHASPRSDGHKRQFFDNHQDTARTITGYACACMEGRGHGLAERLADVAGDAGLHMPLEVDGTRHSLRDQPGSRLGPAGRQPRLPAPPTRPAIVLDPFGGTGTTALVASAHGRVGITIDRSADYCRLAAWRVNDPGERARARDMPKPPPIPDGQAALFGLEAL